MQAALNGIQLIAHRCFDAAETTEFYESILGMTLTTCLSRDNVSSTDTCGPHMHIFLDCGDNNVLAFFEIAEEPALGCGRKACAGVQHLSFRTESVEHLEVFKARAQSAGLEVFGPTDHGNFRSIYFFDPNGHRIEVTCETSEESIYSALEVLAPVMLDEWNKTTMALKHIEA